MVPAKRRSNRKRTSRQIKRVTRRQERIKIIAILVTFSVLGVVGTAFTQNLLAGDFVLVDTIEVHGENLVIGANCLGMVGGISAERGEYIQLGIDGALSERPNVYDVFRDVAENFDVKIEDVKITRIVDNHFLSVITFSSGNKLLEADARPSDSIALALRTGSPIYFNKTFLEANGINICSEDAS